jgi:hypothetical protein
MCCPMSALWRRYRAAKRFARELVVFNVGVLLKKVVCVVYSVEGMFSRKFVLLF